MGPDKEHTLHFTLLLALSLNVEDKSEALVTSHNVGTNSSQPSVVMKQMSGSMLENGPNSQIETLDLTNQPIFLCEE